MTRTRILVCLLTATILAFSLVDIGFAFQNEPEGFRGLKWGDPPTEEMVIDTVENMLMWYTRDNDKVHIGPAELKRIRYVFYKGKLMRIGIEPNHFEGKDLEDVLVLKFGNPEDVSSTWRRHADYTRVKDVTYTWLGEKTRINFYRQFRWREIWGVRELASTGKSRLIIYSVQISDEYAKALDRKAEEARRKRKEAIKKGLADF